MKGINLFLADGFEDIEALATYDVLKRAGIDVRLISISEEPFVMSAHSLSVGVDDMLSMMEIDHSDCCAEDMMIFPGGMPGTRNLASCDMLMSAMKAHYAAGGSLAAICAAPGYVLGQLDGWEGRRFTCYDGCAELPLSKGGVLLKEGVVCDGRIISGRSAGYAVEFGLAIVAYLLGNQAAENLRYSLFLD